jgi:four helix bundle protein
LATVKRFEDLECWQEARILVKLVYKLTNKTTFKKDFELVKQIRRSAVSSMANIAEGFHRHSDKDFMRFLDYSRGSIAETLSHCYVALDQKYIDEVDLSEMRDRADAVWKKVNNFISYLKKTSKKQNNPNHSN